MATFVVNLLAAALTIGGAKTMIQLKAGSLPLKLVRASLGQQGQTANGDEVIYIQRMTSGSTVSSVVPIYKGYDGRTSTAVSGTSATGVNGSVEGTPGDVLHAVPFNVQQGFLWLSVPEVDEIWIPPTTIIAMRFPVAPANQTWYGKLEFAEIS